MFVISSGSKVGKNTMPIIFRLEDGAYLEGMLAAGLSKTGKIGCVGATKEAPLERIFAAFERGAKVINPKIQMIPPTYTGDWDDANKAKQQALALLNQGADVIMQDVDSAAKGVFTAVQEFNKTHPGAAWALGTNGDQNSVAPDVVVASAPIYTDKAFVAIAKQAKAGTLKANDTPFGMKDGVIDFVVNPALKSKISVQLLADIESTRKTIIDGSTDVLKDK
jgi:basic membrane lipoprotein Med (substrate-binding protein (PBP1-ABC) superfamily)